MLLIVDNVGIIGNSEFLNGLIDESCWLFVIFGVLFYSQHSWFIKTKHNIYMIFRRLFMARQSIKLGELVKDALAIKEQKEKLRVELKIKERALEKSNRSVKEKFNAARVAFYMSSAPLLFDVLGIKPYTSLEVALQDESNIDRLNSNGKFDVLFEDDKQLVADLADFIRNHPEIRDKMVEFINESKAHYAELRAEDKGNLDE